MPGRRRASTSRAADRAGGGAGAAALALDRGAQRGADLLAERPIVRGSSEPRRSVPKPCSTTKGRSCSTHSSTDGADHVEVQQPPDLRGSRPAATAASSIVSFDRAMPIPRASM